MKEEVRAAINELISEKFACGEFEEWSGDVDTLRVEELVDLWVLFPLEPSDREVSLRIAQIEHVTNALMASIGAHEKVIELYRNEFIRRFGNHMDAKRVESLPGLTKEVRDVIKRVAAHGVAVEESGPRWDLRLTMNAKLAEEHGKVAMEKVIKDGRNGRIVLFSSLVEKELLADERRLMVAKVIRVAKRFLSGAVNPADSRWCNAQLDANILTPAAGIGPGGSVKLPTQGDAGKKGMVQLAMARP